MKKLLHCDAIVVDLLAFIVLCVSRSVTVGLISCREMGGTVQAVVAIVDHCYAFKSIIIPSFVREAELYLVNAM